MTIKNGDKGLRVETIQLCLREKGFLIVADGNFGPATEKALIRFQKSIGLVADGIAGPATWTALVPKPDWLREQSEFDDIDPKNNFELEDTESTVVNHVIASFNNYGNLVQKLADKLIIEPEAAHAVIATESAGSGFSLEKPFQMIIRFEVHLFWKYWGKYHPNAFDTLFRFNRTGKLWEGHQFAFDGVFKDFHGNQNDEWKAFNIARDLDEEAAIYSTSFGAPQLLGRHFTDLEFTTAKEFFDYLNASDKNQIIALFDFCLKHTELLTALQELDWYAFAYKYNGSGQVETYGLWLADRYKTAKQITKTLEEIV